jgi:hypothetical protein
MIDDVQALRDAWQRRDGDGWWTAVDGGSGMPHDVNTLSSSNSDILPDPTTSFPAHSTDQPPSAKSMRGQGRPWQYPRWTISIEFEKPNRPGLDGLVGRADVLFFSRIYAEGKGFPDAPTGFLDNMRSRCRPG